jgi:hypothetical protein
MDINELKQFEIFNNLNDKEVSLFKEKMKKITIAEGENFIVEGDVGDSIYLTLPFNKRYIESPTSPSTIKFSPSAIVIFFIFFFK